MFMRSGGGIFKISGASDEISGREGKGREGEGRGNGFGRSV